YGRMTAFSDSGRLDRADEGFKSVRRGTDVICELANNFKRLRSPPDLHEFVDEILAGLQHAQELHEFAARSPQIVRCSFGLINQLAPFIDEVLLFLSRESRFLLERPQFLAGVT